MYNIVYVRNWYIHYYDSNAQKAEIKEFNAFKNQYKLKVQSKKYENEEKELTFDQILIDYVLPLNDAIVEYKNQPKDKLLHLIFLRIISSRYTISRLLNYFKNKKIQILDSYNNILTQKGISYLSVNKTTDPNEFKLPEASYLSSIIYCLLESEKPSKTLISKSILEIIYKKDLKIKHHVLIKDKETEKIFFAYDTNENSENKGFRIAQKSILNNMFNLELKAKNNKKEKYVINHKYLVNLLLNYEYGNKKNFRAIILESIGTNKKQLDGFSNYLGPKSISEIKIQKYLTNVTILFESKRETLAIKMLLSKIWKYKYKEKEEIEKLEKEELDNYKNFRKYFLTKTRKNKLIAVLLKKDDVLDKDIDKEFLKNFSYFCDFDYESRTPLKKQLLNEVEKLLNEDKISLGKNKSNENNGMQRFKIIRTNGQYPNEFSLLRICLSKTTIEKIKEQFSYAPQEQFKKKLNELTTRIVIKNLATITDNLNSNLLQEFKIQNPKDFRDLKLNKYDEKNNDDQSININKHIYSTPLYRSILEYVNENKEKTQNDHKDVVKIYEL